MRSGLREGGDGGGVEDGLDSTHSSKTSTDVPLFFESPSSMDSVELNSSSDKNGS